MGKFEMEAKTFSITNAAVPATGLTAVGTVLCHGHYTTLVFEAANTGVALQDFELQIQPHEDASFHTYITGAGWDATTNMVKPFTSDTDLDTLPDGEAEGAYVLLGPVYAIKFLAQAASTTTSITIVGTLFR